MNHKKILGEKSLNDFNCDTHTQTDYSEFRAYEGLLFQDTNENKLVIYTFMST